MHNGPRVTFRKTKMFSRKRSVFLIWFLRQSFSILKGLFFYDIEIRVVLISQNLEKLFFTGFEILEWFLLQYCRSINFNQLCRKRIMIISYRFCFTAIFVFQVRVSLKNAVFAIYLVSEAIFGI